MFILYFIWHSLDRCASSCCVAATCIGIYTIVSAWHIQEGSGGVLILRTRRAIVLLLRQQLLRGRHLHWHSHDSVINGISGRVGRSSYIK